MLISDIIKRVRALVGDTSALQFDDPTLITWINDGIRECAQENVLLQKSATSTLVAGTSSYTLPADILKLYTISVDGGQISLITFQDWTKQNYDPSETGLPVIGYIWAGKYNVWPTPDKAYTVEVDYIYDPVDIATDGSQNASTPPIPSTYHARLVDYCVAQVALQDGDQQLYAIKMEEFSTGVRRLSDQTQEQDDLYPTISISPRDMGDGSLDWAEWG